MDRLDDITTSRPRTPEQARLDFDPPPLHPHPLRTDPQHHLLNELGARAMRARAILARLRMGPATSAELAQVGGLRFHARLQEMRNKGFVFSATRAGSLWEYRLIAEPAR